MEIFSYLDGHVQIAYRYVVVFYTLVFFCFYSNENGYTGYVSVYISYNVDRYISKHRHPFMYICWWCITLRYKIITMMLLLVLFFIKKMVERFMFHVLLVVEVYITTKNRRQKKKKPWKKRNQTRMTESLKMDIFKWSDKNRRWFVKMCKIYEGRLFSKIYFSIIKLLLFWGRIGKNCLD